MEGTGDPLQLKGTERVEDWKMRLERVRGEIRARDRTLRDKRESTGRARSIAIAVSLIALAIAFLAGLALDIIWLAVLGVLLGIAGTIAACVLFKPPEADFIGPERADFVTGLLTELAAIAPRSRVTLAAQLDVRRALPKAALPSGSADAKIEKESNEAWLSGSLTGIPGLRLSWQATERRRLRLVRKKVVRRKTKIKTKAKFAIHKRLSVRLDADGTLFRVKDVPIQKSRPEDGTVEVRKASRGWSVRGRMGSSIKAELLSGNVEEELAALREKGAGELLGDRLSALLSLMKLCEGLLLPAPAKERAK